MTHPEYVLAEFLVKHDHEQGTTVAVDVANVMSKTIDSWCNQDRPESEQRSIQLAFSALVDEIVEGYGQDFMEEYVICPESCYFGPGGL